jgi:phage terminase large subunit
MSTALKSAVSPIVERSILTFARFLGLELYEWQHLLCRTVEKGAEHERIRVALAAPNGSGKSSICATVSVLRWLSQYPKAKVILTSADAKQLDSQLMPSLRSHAAKFPRWEFLGRAIRTPEGGQCLAFTTDESARAEGHHSDRDAPLLIIIDEANSVLLMVSSPGLKMGRFFDAFSAHRDRYLFVKQVGLADCPHISQARIDDVIATYGQDAEFTKSTLYGEFMEQDLNQPMAVNFESLRLLLETPPHAKISPNDTTAFCDFAAGGDENVLAIRSGNKLQELIGWRDSNTTASVGRFILLFRRYGLKASQIWGDNGGLGHPMCDMLRDAGWPINRTDFGARARDEKLFLNVATELWAGLGRKIERGEIVLLNDPVLIAQLTTRKLFYDSRGRLRIEPKDDLRARGVRSPDRADAVCACFYYGSTNFYRPGQRGVGSGYYRPSDAEAWAGLGSRPQMNAEEWFYSDGPAEIGNGELDHMMQAGGAWTG